MTSLAISAIVLACMVGGLLLGMRIHGFLPDHHTTHESRDVMKTAAGMMATLVALIIGLLVSSAKSSFDSTSASITQGGAKIITLDCFLSRYGAEAKDVRDTLHQVVATGVERIWPTDGVKAAGLKAVENATGMEKVFDGIRNFTPQNPSQEYLKSQALQLATDLMQSRWMMIEQSQNSLPAAFLIVLGFWLAVLFATFGLLTPRNFTAMSALFISALSMAGAIFLILELNRPLEGTIKVSDAPLRKALAVTDK